MKVLQLFNQYRSPFGGEETVVYRDAEILRKRGHQVNLVLKTSKVLLSGLKPKFWAFWNGTYSPSAYREMVRLLETEKPDIVHVHNLYPLFSPSVLVACTRACIPVVMTVHNFILTCPNWFHLHKGQVCDKCIGGREYFCILNNCRENIFESVGYALRTAVARKWDLFRNNVSWFIALSEFSRTHLINAGFRGDRITVLPNTISIPTQRVDVSTGKYIAYAGRLSSEKGIEIILAAASLLPDITFKLAGDGPMRSVCGSKAPPNVFFMGSLSQEELQEFYQGARLVVLASICFEVCPLGLLEAQSHGLPIVASRVGGIPELVEDGVTGLLFEPRNSRELADKIRLLTGNAELSERIGFAAREKIIRENNEELYFSRLVNIYERAIARSRLAS
jgi:glycosyltransferase involved in cell wall biosynthesis